MNKSTSENSNTQSKIGRPSIYSEELANEICRRIANGQSLVTICNDEAMPSRETIYAWINEKPEFSDKYARAKEDQADFKAEEIETIADKALKGEYKADVARVAIDAKKWTASKLKPKKYGEKLDVTSAGEKVEPIVIYRPEKLKDE